MNTGIRTLAIIKPDAIAAGHAHAIANRIRSEQFVIRATTRITLSGDDIDALYGASKDKPWYPKHAAFMASGPCDVLVLERANAVDHWRRVIGATDPRKAEPGTIRASFGDQNQEPGHCFRNAVHGSDTDEAAEREIAIFFGSRQANVKDLQRWLAAPEGEPDPHVGPDGRAVVAPRLCWCGKNKADHTQIQDGNHHPFKYSPLAPGNFDAASMARSMDRMYDLDLNRELTTPAPRSSNSPRPITLSAVAAESERARRKFPGGRFLLAAIVEEVGELAGAIATGNAEDVYTEAIQVAAVAVRIAEEGERTRYQMDRVIQAVVALGMGVRFLLQRNAIDAKASFGIAANAARRIHESGDSTFDDLTDEEAKP